jgi:hypothetical protein
MEWTFVINTWFLSSLNLFIFIYEISNYIEISLKNKRVETKKNTQIFRDPNFLNVFNRKLFLWAYETKVRYRSFGFLGTGLNRIRFQLFYVKISVGTRSNSVWPFFGL